MFATQELIHLAEEAPTPFLITEKYATSPRVISGQIHVRISKE